MGWSGGYSILLPSVTGSHLFNPSSLGASQGHMNLCPTPPEAYCQAHGCSQCLVNCEYKHQMINTIRRAATLKQRHLPGQCHGLHKHVIRGC